MNREAQKSVTRWNRRDARFRQDGEVGLVRGFTLVELLVVVSVLGIVGALLLPALGRAKGKASATICLGNQRQLALAFHLYCGDHGDVFPAAAGSSAFGAQPEDWLWWQIQVTADGQAAMRSAGESVLARYLDGYRSSYFRCPADKDALAREAAWKQDMNRELYTYSYSLNAHSEQGMASYISKARCVIRLNKLGSVVNPSRKIMLAEEKGSPDDGPGDAFIDDGRWQPLGYPLTSRHAGKANVAFADGHVETVLRSFADSSHPEHFDPQK
jgi:prepilin-type processing-associated H-X9-DG protein/prepilin-type N-terminal cleavage/methylation domain-containing protein